MTPVRLAPNVFEHQYRGGARIAALRGLDAVSNFSPEEWLGATSGMFVDPTKGPARTIDGELLQDLVAKDAGNWMGTSFTGTHPGDSGVLFKLLDAAQRLPVHVHPDRAFAQSRLGSHYGKTEAWLVLAASDDRFFHLGWTEDVDSTTLQQRRDAQDSAWMLERMHHIRAERGLSILVPAGWVHAIDEGIFLAEIQEPTDFSIVLEWSATTVGREDAALRLGWEQAGQAADLQAVTPAQIQALVRRNDLDSPAAGVRPTLAPTAAGFFRLEHVVATAEHDAAVRQGFGVALVIDGAASLSSGAANVNVVRGDVLAIPDAFGDWTLHGEAQLLLARPAFKEERP